MLDTDTCIAIIKKHPAALRKLSSKSIGQVGLSSISLGELAFGAAKSSRPKDAGAALQEFLLALEIASFDDQAALRFGEICAALALRGKPIGPLDTLIGSHAQLLDVVLVTHNTREFSQIKNLRLDDWLSS
jgi:tRNA(fMet)-specific endonuclease VapC